MQQVLDLEQALLEVSTIEGAGEAFEAAIKPYGFFHYDFGSFLTARLNDAETAMRFFHYNYYDGDLLKYFPKNWPDGDPVVEELSRRSQPFDYVQLLRDRPVTMASMVHLGMMKVWRVRHAWMVPLSSTTHLQFVTVYMRGEEDRERFEAARVPIFLMGAALMDRAVALHEAAMPVRERIVFTPEEQDCLKLLCEGKSNPEIARALDISVNTVRYHLKKIFRKLGATSRTQAATMARGLGQGG